MNRLILTAATFATMFGMANPLRAENVEHTQQLLATKQCPKCELSRVGLVFAQLPGANLSGANLVGANLSQANLTGANLSGANLTGASLNGANLEGANLTGANLTGADLRSAYLGTAILTASQIEGAQLQGAVGLAPTTGNPDDFYRWGMEAAQRKNYAKAIENFNQVLSRKSDHAPSYLGRGMSRFQLGDRPGAVQDMELAVQLFESQGDKTTAESTKKIAAEIKKPPQDDVKGGNGLGIGFLQLAGSLLRLFVFRSL
jgi:tetratricopeptide (TPR) repeat protein